MYRSIILPSSILAATIIGAGAFVIPFVFVQAGLITGLFYLAVFAVAFTLIYLMYADIILRTKEDHRFAGYAEFYLGKSFKWPTILSTIVGMFFILTVYLILSASFINFIWPAAPDIYKIAAFWLVASLAILLKINRLAVSEFLTVIGIVTIVLIAFIYGLKDFEKIFSVPLVAADWHKTFLPYGAILFALAGKTAIPTILGYFRKNNQPFINVKPVIILGVLLPAIVYFIFAVTVINLSGAVSVDAVSGLADYLPSWLTVLFGVLGFIAIWSTYIVIGRDIEKSLIHDVKLSNSLAAAIVFFSPLALYFLGFQNFLELIKTIGGVFVGIEGLLIVLIWEKAVKISPVDNGVFKKPHSFIGAFLFLIFFIGAIYEIIY
ncbi:hypothetical protein HZB06_00565 [Candidatus Wolfebacteria bacterium]|nr:hypothetical protein [Candidatus Wolfebacteria bacterium]